jgi:predicted ester cyclase
MIFVTSTLNFCCLKNSHLIHIMLKKIKFSKYTLYNILNMSIKNNSKIEEFNNN